MEEVRRGLLVLEEPIDRRFVVHGFGNRLGGCFPICFEQQFWIVVHVDNRWVEPDGNDDPKVIGFVLRNVPCSNSIEYTMGNGRLKRFPSRCWCRANY